MMTEPKRFGKYEIIAEIGRGGFAAVYKARDADLDRTVALKVLHPYWGEDQSFVTRFRQEARTAARLRHPHIVTVYETGEADGQLYIATEDLPGRTLRELLESEGALSLARALPILEQLARALDYAHGQGVVHRDIKPSNVMVEETADGVQVTLMDFGLVKAMSGSSTLTSQGTLLGSPEYMAPEQADPSRADEIGPATDRYALGVMAYQMLTGQVPFPGNTPATLTAHLNLSPPDPRSVCANLSPSVCQVLLKALSKSSRGRYSTAMEMVDALHQVATGSGQTWSSIWKWVLVGALVVTLLGGGVWIGSLIPPRSMPTEATTTLTPETTSTPTATSTRIREKDGAVMVYVPAGVFWMGSSDVDPDADDDEKPQHQVYVDAFWIDKTEVTNAQYKRCVDEGVCSPPAETGSYTRGAYYGNPEFGDYPVINVTWYQAREYAEWVGGRLPTEAEWEYATRGPNGYVYPWGNDPPDDSLLNYNDSVGDTTAVGSYPDGASWCRALDMVGNVWEWTGSQYTPYPYDATDGREDLEVSGDTLGVIRGGSFQHPQDIIRCAYRYEILPSYSWVTIGFRVCVAPD
jgi:formylglycine-generating enzyme required for sulfatase activity